MVVTLWWWPKINFGQFQGYAKLKCFLKFTCRQRGSAQCFLKFTCRKRGLGAGFLKTIARKRGMKYWRLHKEVARRGMPNRQVFGRRQCRGGPMHHGGRGGFSWRTSRRHFPAALDLARARGEPAEILSHCHTAVRAVMVFVMHSVTRAQGIKCFGNLDMTTRRPCRA